MKRKHIWMALGAVVILALLFWGYGAYQKKAAGAAARQQPPTLVNAFTAFQSDTPLLQQYSGHVEAQQKVPVQARVTGYIVEKYVQGGQQVTAGQALYRIDARQYQSSLAAAQANTAQARANYESAVQDLERYRTLIAQGAISDQQFTRQQALVEQYRAVVEANEAQASIAGDNVADTVVRAPFSGTLGVDDLPVGNFVAAGQTPLVTISSTDPIFVTFDLTEAEYLKMTQRQNSSGAWGQELKLQLADGSQYGETGQVVVIDQDMSGGGGQFTVKASFTNPQQILRQGMFVQVISDTEIARNSILIPAQAVQPLLDKKIVTVVDAEHKVSQRPVEVGATYGPYVVITSGIVAGDTVVVEGQAKVRNGQAVQVKMLSRDEVEHPQTKQAAPAAGKQ
ncbi:MAG: efflux RND transporter periplasmic adaptor subunit [Negativicoccus succinicivorans]|uniref:Uncharacterized protein n=2 Tax=Negativicoccus succinicivorans TaxID=620903 RepID=W1TU31_9FIRM|nr:MAG: hypothetical protein Q612_NSC00348G0018 [Negativicoccus succinicivorans DORA_17_25]KGF12447.1 hypothetical protein HMPREF1633_01420 [Tissierellia bacterium S5-A11]MBS5916749.1 efflux RND transporter periplasmic adaptor subunit [Negativicoccus succinicivorans]